MAPLAGFEPAAYSLGENRSIHLSYKGNDMECSIRGREGQMEGGGLVFSTKFCWVASVGFSERWRWLW